MKLCNYIMNVGVSTQVPARAWIDAWRNTWGLPLPVKLEIRQITFTMLMQRNTQPIVRINPRKVIYLSTIYKIHYWKKRTHYKYDKQREHFVTILLKMYKGPFLKLLTHTLWLDDILK